MSRDPTGGGAFCNIRSGLPQADSEHVKHKSPQFSRNRKAGGQKQSQMTKSTTQGATEDRTDPRRVARRVSRAGGNMRTTRGVVTLRAKPEKNQGARGPVVGAEALGYRNAGRCGRELVSDVSHPFCPGGRSSDGTSEPSAPPMGTGPGTSSRAPEEDAGTRCQSHQTRVPGCADACRGEARTGGGGDRAGCTGRGR